MDARGEKRKALDQALDMRVLALLIFQQQAARDFRVAVREFARQAAQVRQFFFVIGQQLIEHLFSRLFSL